ncbi:MAG TPA: YicC/YloC family endoribonuclease [Planctomycetota bacterium]
MAEAGSTNSSVARSMTGYGRAVVDDAPRLTAEIRSVNGRFLKLSLKIPGRYGALEDRVKTLMNEAGVKRGNVDVMLFFDGDSGESAYGLNEATLKLYASQARTIAKRLKLSGSISIGSLLPLPGVIQRVEQAEDIEAVWKRCRKALLAALKQFNGMREQEGAAILADIRAQLAKLAEHRTAIELMAPEMIKTSLAKFKERINKLLADAQVSAPMNPDVLERETVLQGDRYDVSEELARLQSHFDQMESTLAGGGETGKKLDFLTQELFRETNTIGSKAQDERITHRVVEMKGLIEKIREQVQNLE